MNRLNQTLFTLSAPLALLSAPFLHAELDTKTVSADAKWVMHLDFAKLRETVLGKELVKQAAVLQAGMEKPLPLQIDLAKLLTTIGTVTAYGENFEKDPNRVDGTLILQGGQDLRTIVEGLVAQGEVSAPDKVTQLKDFPIEAYSIDGQVVLAFPKEPIVIVSKSKAQLLKAREVYVGKQPSLAKEAKSPLRPLVKPEKNAFFFAASMVPDEKFFDKDAPPTRILTMAHSSSVQLGEIDKRAFAQVQMQATSDEAADKLAKILQGMAALVSMTESNDKQLAEFLKSVAVARNDNTVTLRAAYSSDRILELVQMAVKAEENDRRRAKGETILPEIRKEEGKVVAEWTADQDLGSDAMSASNFLTTTAPNVSLKSGTLITLIGRREGGENARIDRVEISPVGGGAALRFEAEYMKLRGYSTENFKGASGGKVVMTTSPYATAQFQFPGEDGNYSMTIRYVDENDGKAKFAVATKDEVSAPEAPAVPAVAPVPPVAPSANKSKSL